MSLLTSLASRIKTKIETFSISLSQIADGLITLAKINTTGATTGQVPTFNGTNTTWEDPAGGGGSLIPLTTTFADCENTTSEIDIVTVTIPADTLAVGDIVGIELRYLKLQNSGSSINTYFWMVNNGNKMQTDAVLPVSSSATMYFVFQTIRLIVVNITGNTVTLGYTRMNNTAGLSHSMAINFNSTQNTNGVTSATTQNETFDNTIGTTLQLRMQWVSANVNAYIRVQQAQAYIIKKAV